MEFDTISTDLAEVVIEASSRDEAVELAIQNYRGGEDLDYYASDHMESRMSENHTEWIVEEKDK